MFNLQFSHHSIKQLIEPSLDKLLVILAIIAFLLMSPYFVWSNQLIIFRIAHFLGDAILIYIFIKYHNLTIYNISLVLFFFAISIYMMIGGTQYSKLTYIPLLALFFITLKPIEQVRIFDLLVSILAFFYVIGLTSYFLRLVGLNISIGNTIAPNLAKNPYHIYFGHIEESGLPVYRFCSVFDEAGVVGTTNGLILASIGISKKDFKSIIILLAGLISFSLAFYVILSVILISQLNIKYILITGVIVMGIIFFAGNRFNSLIADRLVVVNGQLAGDNRTADEFDDYYNIFLSRGGKDLIFGKGDGFYQNNKEDNWFTSSYKTKIIDWGILGTGLLLCFYFLSTVTLNNSIKGWTLCFIFIISAYQRPDLTSYVILILYLGGLNYLKLNLVKNPSTKKWSIFQPIQHKIEFEK